MCNKIVGKIKCPICGSADATIHQHAKGKQRKFYIRCYEGEGSSVMRCGTIQCLGPTGQKFIQEKGVFLEGEKSERLRKPEKKPAEPKKKDAIALPTSETVDQNAIESGEGGEIDPPPKKKTLYQLLVG